MASLNPHAQPFSGSNYYYNYKYSFLPQPAYLHTYDHHQMPYYQQPFVPLPPVYPPTYYQLPIMPYYPANDMVSSSVHLPVSVGPRRTNDMVSRSVLEDLPVSVGPRRSNDMASRSVHLPVSVGPRRSMTQRNRDMQLLQQENHMNTEASSSEQQNGGVIHFPSNLEEQESFSPTTVMIKNIPYHFRRRDLLNILKCHCWIENGKILKHYRKKSKEIVDRSMSEFDFVYLPMDFERREFSNAWKNSHLGYAYVNFTTPVAALRFYRCYHNRKWKNATSYNETYEVACAEIQGKRALLEHFENKIIQGRSEECLPVIVEPPCDGRQRPTAYHVGKLSDPSRHA